MSLKLSVFLLQWIVVARCPIDDIPSDFSYFSEQFLVFHPLLFAAADSAATSLNISSLNGWGIVSKKIINVCGTSLVWKQIDIAQAFGFEIPEGSGTWG